MDNEKYLTDFQIVAMAGDSRSKSMMAIKAAREGDFEKAEQLLKAAEEGMNQAHNIQFQMLQNEANGKPVDVTIVTVHGQDHMTMALVTHDLAAEIIALYKRIEEK